MKRILTAVIVLPFLIASILVASLWWVFVLLAVAAMVMGLWEFYLLAKKLQLKPDPGAGYVAGAAILTISLQNDPAINVLLVQFVIIVLTAGTLIAATLRGAPFDKMIASTGATILGVLYVPLLGSHLVSLRIGFTQQLSAHLLSFFFLVLKQESRQPQSLFRRARNTRSADRAPTVRDRASSATRLQKSSRYHDAARPPRARAPHPPLTR